MTGKKDGVIECASISEPQELFKVEIEKEAEATDQSSVSRHLRSKPFLYLFGANHTDPPTQIRTVRSNI